MTLFCLQSTGRESRRLFAFPPRPGLLHPTVLKIETLSCQTPIATRVRPPFCTRGPMHRSGRGEGLLSVFTVREWRSPLPPFGSAPNCELDFFSSLVFRRNTVFGLSAFYQQFGSPPRLGQPFFTPYGDPGIQCDSLFAPARGVRFSPPPLRTSLPPIAIFIFLRPSEFCLHRR